jgi:hypothetical protein
MIGWPLARLADVTVDRSGAWGLAYTQSIPILAKSERVRRQDTAFSGSTADPSVYMLRKHSERATQDRLLVLATMLRPIVRLLLRHGVGVGELLEAAKRAYVESAIAEVTPPGRRPNISRLSVMTGLTRKDIADLIGTYYMGRSSGSRRTPQQRALRVLRGWLLDPHFSRGDGTPTDLSLLDGKGTFPALVRKYGGDVTPVAVLSELERMRATSRTRGGSCGSHHSQFSEVSTRKCGSSLSPSKTLPSH